MKARIQAQWLSLVARVRGWLPEHQIYLRANGKVRFLVLSTGMQAAAIGFAALALLWLGLTSWTFFNEDNRLAAKDRKIAEMNGRFAALAQDMTTLEHQVLSQARKLEERQNVIRAVLSEGFLGERLDQLAAQAAPSPATLATSLVTADKDALTHASEGTLPELYGDRYAAIETRQVGLVTHLRDMARLEMERVEETLSAMKLSTGDLVGGGNEGLGGVGGPLLPEEDIATLAVSNDPIGELLEDWSQLKLVREAVRSIPAIGPVKDYFFSSNFGRRRDPLTEGWAFHSGIDMGAWYGSTVMATTDGIVTHAGYKAGYGKMVEIDHGNGFRTRYGHLRKVTVKRGQAVVLGDKIAESGNTGRSTGPHLHYEIWLHGKPVNPKPFIEASQNVLEIQRRSSNG
ncbi:MAG: M23 family metallopeptidase [Pseudomonadota bacterium]